MEEKERFPALFNRTLHIVFREKFVENLIDVNNHGINSYRVKGVNA